MALGVGLKDLLHPHQPVSITGSDRLQVHEGRGVQHLHYGTVMPPGGVHRCNDFAPVKSAFQAAAAWGSMSHQV